MRAIALTLLTCVCCLSLPLGCGGAESGGSIATATATDPGATSIAAAPTASAAAGKTVAATARAYVAAWAAQDAAALAGLLTPDTRAAWGLGGGMSKWLADQRGDYAAPL